MVAQHSARGGDPEHGRRPGCGCTLSYLHRFGCPDQSVGNHRFLRGPLRVFSHRFRVNFENHFRELLDSAGTAG